MQWNHLEKNLSTLHDTESDLPGHSLGICLSIFACKTLVEDLKMHYKEKEMMHSCMLKISFINLNLKAI